MQRWITSSDWFMHAAQHARQGLWAQSTSIIGEFRASFVCLSPVPQTTPQPSPLCPSSPARYQRPLQERTRVYVGVLVRCRAVGSPWVPGMACCADAWQPCRAHLSWQGLARSSLALPGGRERMACQSTDSRLYVCRRHKLAKDAGPTPRKSRDGDGASPRQGREPRELWAFQSSDRSPVCLAWHLAGRSAGQRAGRRRPGCPRQPGGTPLLHAVRACSHPPPACPPACPPAAAPVAVQRHVTFDDQVDVAPELLHEVLSEPSKHIYFKDLKLLANEEASSGVSMGPAGAGGAGGSRRG